MNNHEKKKEDDICDIQTNVKEKADIIGNLLAPKEHKDERKKG